MQLTSGASTQLTHGSVPRTGWDNRDDEAGPGVLDHRSVLTVAANELIYFAGERGEKVCQVNVGSLDQSTLFEIPADYYAGGQNCISPDGRYFVYILNPIGSRYMKPLPDKPSKLVACEFATGTQKTLCDVNFHIHHALPYGNERFVGCHTATANGLAYEVIPLNYGKENDDMPGTPNMANRFYSGLYDPVSRSRFEFPLPDYFQTTHVGWDPEGVRWFWEIAGSWADPSSHKLVYLKRIEKSGAVEFVALTPDWQNYGTKQKSHHHPQLTPDRNWLLFVAGDSRTKTKRYLPARRLGCAGDCGRGSSVAQHCRRE